MAVTSSQGSGITTYNRALRPKALIRLPDGLTAQTAAPSAVFLKENGVSVSGNYWITINGTARQIYCDMVNDNGGWMLYTSFSSDNPFQATTNPAINGNRIRVSEFSTYGYSLNATTDWADGYASQGFGPSYTRRPEYFGHFSGGSPTGELTLATWLGPTAVTELRLLHGTGATSASYNAGGSGIITNNVSRVTGNSEVYTTRTDVVPFNPSGTTPLFRQLETGIAGISWIFVR
jgi:hypothetical protein